MKGAGMMAVTEYRKLEGRLFTNELEDSVAC